MNNNLSGLFQHIPSSLYGKYDFIYDTKRKLNYIFKYSLAPKYGRYIFLYLPQDEFFVERPFSLQVAQQKNVVDMEDNLYTLKNATLIKGIKEHVHSSIDRVEYHVREFIDYSLRVNTRDITLFDLGDECELSRTDREIYSYSLFDYVLERIPKSFLKESSLLLEKISPSNFTNFNEEDFSFSLENTTEIISSVQKDVVLKQTMEDIYLYELTLNKLRKEIEGVFIEDSEKYPSVKEFKDIDLEDGEVNEGYGQKDYKQGHIVIEDSFSTNKEAKDGFQDKSKTDHLLEKINKKIKTEYDVMVEEIEEKVIQESEEKIIKNKVPHIVSGGLDTDIVIQDKTSKNAVTSEDIVIEGKVEKQLARLKEKDGMIKKTGENVKLIDLDTDLLLGKTPSIDGMTHSEDINARGAVSDSPVYDMEKEVMSAESAGRKAKDQSKEEIEIDVKAPARQIQQADDIIQIKHANEKLDNEDQRPMGDIHEDVRLFREGQDALDGTHVPEMVNKTTSRRLNEGNKSVLISSDSGREMKKEELVRLEQTKKKAIEEVDKRLDMHKRFWFVKKHGKIDYKILPNRDFDYPMDITILHNAPDESFFHKFDTRYRSDIDGEIRVEIYDKDCHKISHHVVSTIRQDYDETKNGIGIFVKSIQKDDWIVSYEIKVFNENMAYMIIRQPLDWQERKVHYIVTDPIIINKHPIPFGNDLGIKEIPVHIPIMADFINILLLMWSKFYFPFTGYTGTKAIYGLVNVVHDWLTLENSLGDENIEDYHRCFRWLRWEAEKMYNKAKVDVDLNGNAWIEALLFELIDYMEVHHINTLPEYEPISLMDEYRNLFNDPSFDIPIVVDKVKGIRKRVLEKRKRFND